MEIRSLPETIQTILAQAGGLLFDPAIQARNQDSIPLA
jgi:hypothetical protein